MYIHIEVCDAVTVDAPGCCCNALEVSEVSAVLDYFEIVDMEDGQTLHLVPRLAPLQEPATDQQPGATANPGVFSECWRIVSYVHYYEQTVCILQAVICDL